MKRLAIVLHFNGYPTKKWYRVSLHAETNNGEYSKIGFTKFFETQEEADTFAKKYADMIEYKSEKGMNNLI